MARRLQVVPDVLLSQSLQQVEAPKAATSSRSVLAGIMGNPVSMRRYKVTRPYPLGPKGRPLSCAQAVARQF
jgi:hypothetical protein